MSVRSDDLFIILLRSVVHRRSCVNWVHTVKAVSVRPQVSPSKGLVGFRTNSVFDSCRL
jgi:hypothetical protein